jgi:DNA-binding NtrC family response regulator
MATALPLYPEKPILLVDDDPMVLRITERVLRKAGLSHVLTCLDSRRALDMLVKHRAGVVCLDLMMPHIGGEELLETITQDYPDTLAIIFTATEDVNTAVRCIKKGAFDYITKPIDLSRLAVVIKNALALQQLQQENTALRNRIISPDLQRPEVFAGIVTRNPQMVALFQYAEAIARTTEPVLITGETGVGKDLLAQALHTLSNSRGSLVAVNVAGLDDNAFSDTLFGHARGAFTGAERMRAGLIEQAAGGTLFLDEIGDLTLAAQAKLLRLLQEGDYFPLGQDNPKRSAARVISATNRDLWHAVKQGVFRKDLNYRLRTHHLHLPPLRERLDDLPLLVDHFLDVAASQLSKPRPQATDKLLTLLGGYAFPGNIRELRMLVFDAVSRSTTKTVPIDPFKLYIGQRQSEQPQSSLISPSREAAADATDTINFAPILPTMKQITDLLLKEALRRSKGNQSVAAKLLGISQQAVSKRLKNHTPRERPSRQPVTRKPMD